MNMDVVIDALGGIDDRMVQEVETLRRKRGKPMWIRWTAIAACFALIATVGWYALTHRPLPIPGPTNPTTDIDLEVIRLIYVNDRRYKPNKELSQSANQENVGSFVGFVSLDGEKETEICAYNYVPNDGKTNRIIVYDEDYRVYSFLSFVEGGTEEWPKNLFADVDHIEIQGCDNEVVAVDMLSLLSQLGEKHKQKALNLRYYELFKEHFADGEIWMDKDGNICKANLDVMIRFSDLVNNGQRRIVLIMEDNTKLSYTYLPSSGVLICRNFGYFLSDEQIEQINQLIGLE